MMCPSAPNAIVLVTFLLLLWNTMTKMIVNQRIEFGFLFQRVRAHGPRVKEQLRTQNLTRSHQAEREREQRELLESFESSKPIHRDTPPPTRPHLLILPSLPSRVQAQAHMQESVGVILTQLTTAVFVLIFLREINKQTNK